MTSEKIVGAWELLRFELQANEGAEWVSWADDTCGLLIYTADGAMSVSVNRNINAEGKLRDVSDLLFYAGFYELDGDRLVHHVTNASDPSRIGNEMIRYSGLTGNTLSLTGRAASGKQFRLMWERVSPSAKFSKDKLVSAMGLKMETGR